MSLADVSLKELDNRTAVSAEQDQTARMCRVDLALHFPQNESIIVKEG